MTAELYRLGDIARIVGVSYERARQLRDRQDFPAPVGRRGKADLWTASDVRRWARTYDGGDRRWGPRDPKAATR
jgi:prophage regulatory protein